MMQSVALTESCFYPAVDDDFVVVEPLLGATVNEGDDDDSYDYCDGVFDTTQENLTLNISFEEDITWNGGSIEESFPQMLEAASSLLLSGIADVDSPAHSVEILSTTISESILGTSRHNDPNVTRSEQPSSVPGGSTEPMISGCKVDYNSKKDFQVSSSGSVIGRSPSLLDERTPTSERIQSSSLILAIQDKVAQDNEHRQFEENRILEKDDEEETSSLPDPYEDTLLTLAEEAESRSWPSRSKQKRLTNKKRRKQMKLARKAAAAAAAAAIVSQGTLPSRHSKSNTKQRVAPDVVQLERTKTDNPQEVVS